MHNKKRKAANIGKDILDAIHKAFPNGIVEMSIRFDESYLRDIYPKLKMELSRIEGAELSYERDAKGGPRGEESSDPEEDPPDWSEQCSSYNLFFVGLTDQRFQYEYESEEPDEDGNMHKVEGIGMIGCTVAVSLLAPYALIKLRCYERFEGGGETCPDIEHQIFSLEGGPIEMENHFRETMGEEAVQSIQALRATITKVLESFGITPLPREDEEKPVPRLQAGEEVFVGKEHTGKDITVQEALFFREL